MASKRDTPVTGVVATGFIEEGEEKAYYDDLFRLSATLRGQFLDMAISVEVLVEELLTQIYTGEDRVRRALFASLVLPKMDFSEKVDLLKRTLLLAYPDIHEDDLLREVTRVRKWRNRLAHTMLDTSEEFTRHRHTDRVQFSYYENARHKQIVVSVADSNKRLAAASETSRRLITLSGRLRELTPRPPVAEPDTDPTDEL